MCRIRSRTCNRHLRLKKASSSLRSGCEMFGRMLITRPTPLKHPCRRPTPDWDVMMATADTSEILALL